MVVMGCPIGPSAEKGWGGRSQPWSMGLLVYFVWVASLILGCAEVENPTDLPTAIHVPASLPSVVTLQPVSPPYSLAILPFEDYSNRPDLSWLRQGLPDMLVTDLARLPGVRVVSRHRLGEVLREQWLQHRGSFEEASTVRLGRLLGARYLLSGQYYGGGDDLVLEVHLLGVENGAVIRTFRVTGSADAIQDLELDLVSRLGQVFDSAAIGQTEDAGSDSFVEDNSPARQFDPQEIRAIQKEVMTQDQLPEAHAPLTTTLRIDTVLGLERLRYVREAAARIAHDLWTQSLVIRLGALRYESQAGNDLGPDSLIVSVPLSATIREETIRRLDSKLTIVEPDDGVEGTDLVLRYEESDAGAQQLFREALQSPRRIFVRAIRESGEVLAVSSEWSWRTDLHVRVHPDGTVSLLRSSSPFLQGNATFGGALLTSHDSTITFDAVVVPVPEESRSISVEFVMDQREVDGPLATERELATSVQTWLLHRWFPPVAESIPTSGYLPGNRRRGVALVFGKGGTISRIQVIQIDEEEKFSQSVNDVLQKLPGTCFQECGNPDSKKAPPKSFTLRVQLELAKDIRHAGLGRLR